MRVRRRSLFLWTLLIVAVIASGLVVNSSRIPVTPAAEPQQLPALGATTHLDGLTREQRQAQFARLAAIGTTWIRVGVGWYAMQPSGPGELDPTELTELDAIVADAAAAGLRVLFIGDQAPGWAGGEDAGTASDPAAYGAFAGLLAQHFRGRGPGGASPAFEVMNEPNGSRSDGRAWATPEQYAATSCAAFRAVKAADPAAEVVVGSLDVSDWEAWLRGSFRAGLGGCFDALSAHPYSGPQVLDQIRSVAASEGAPDASIWVTEFGSSTCADLSLGCVSEADQSRLTVEFLTQMRSAYPWVPVAMVYQDRDEPKNPNGDREQSFGMYRTDASGVVTEAKPVVAALRTLYRGE